jgi:CubicO group peptidase (beta-lactamase class C family)
MTDRDLREPLPTAEELGLMRGSPVAPERLVTLEDWIGPPKNRWALQHLRELVPTARIRRAERPRALPQRDVGSLGSVTFDSLGERWRLDEMLEATATDAMCVLHDGRVALERYANGMRPDSEHLLFSVTKSVTASVIGACIGRGLFGPGDLLSDLIPELEGTSWEGATVQHVLDMRTGTAFVEDYSLNDDSQALGQVYGWFPPRMEGVPRDVTEYLASLRNATEHGGPFDYRSVLTPMLSWVCERASGERFGVLLERHVWGPIGAEFDASLAVDGVGNPMTAGGLSATVRDLARFGQLWLDRGRVGDVQVVPETYVADTIVGAPDGPEAFAEGFAAHFPDEPPPSPHAHYRNQWWILDARAPVFSAIGIHGQFAFVHAPRRTVIAKMSSLPEADDPDLQTLFEDGASALAEALA